jgi:probable F420-dependent oxidoreductase
MDVGLAYFPTDDGIDPATLARAAEERGYESLLIAEHTHIPTSRESPYPGGGEIPPKYFHTYESWVALAYAAAATERLKVGTSVSLVVEHDPILLAKQVASLDRLSGGRVIFGVGAGWNREEMRNHGTDFDHRFGIMRERVEAMKAIWSQDEPEYHGRYVDFDPIWLWPKPVQSPLPVYIGGNGPKVHDRVLRYGDGWMPNMKDLGELGERVAELRERAGRHVPVTYYGATPDTLSRIEGFGVDRSLIALESGPEAEVLASIPSLK